MILHHLEERGRKIGRDRTLLLHFVPASFPMPLGKACDRSIASPTLYNNRWHE